VIAATPPRHPIEMPDLEAVRASNEAPDKALDEGHAEVVSGHSVQAQVHSSQPPPTMADTRGLRNKRKRRPIERYRLAVEGGLV